MEEYKARSSPFAEGFEFAMLFYDSLGLRVPLEEIVERLTAIVSGDFTIISSAADTIAEIEHQRGKPLPKVLCNSVWRMQRSRTESEAHNRESARLVLRFMGIDI